MKKQRDEALREMHAARLRSTRIDGVAWVSLRDLLRVLDCKTAVTRFAACIVRECGTESVKIMPVQDSLGRSQKMLFAQWSDCVSALQRLRTERSRILHEWLITGCP